MLRIANAKNTRERKIYKEIARFFCFEIVANGECLNIHVLTNAKDKIAHQNANDDQMGAIQLYLQYKIG